MTTVRVALVAVVTIIASASAAAYLKLGTTVGDRVVALRWDRLPVRYLVNTRAVAGVSASDLQSAVARAFGTWRGASASAATEFVGFTGIEPFVSDNTNVIGFRARADLPRTVGATTFTVDTVSGTILESDIFLNTAFSWSVSSAGEPGRFDVESIAVHEIGHLFGLGHSALGETELTESGGRRILAKAAVMFPIAYPSGNIRDRALGPDDVAGAADAYGTTRRTGSIGGRVTRAGTGVFGAHVTASNVATGETIAGFTLTARGDFVIGSVPPGIYVLRAEPLDDADVDSFFDDGGMDIAFKPAFAARLATVPAGGAARDVVIQVVAK